jgi:hypothetical protein
MNNQTNMDSNLINKLKQDSRYLQISIPYDKEDELIRFDNGVMNELECNVEFTPPMLNAEDQLLEFVIDLKEGKMLNWNFEGDYMRMWAKVCDGGTYTLLDSEKKPIWQIRGYVPNKLIPPFENGYGDYIELAIEADGKVVDWPAMPDFSDFVADGRSPEPIKTNKWHRAEVAYWQVRGMKLSREEIEWLVEKLQVLS